MSVRKKFRELLHGPGLTLMPGAYDALSARIIEKQGFQAVVAGGYAAVGALLGEADGGQSNVRDYASHYGRICDAVNIPVYVDADTGFGWVHNVAKMVRMFERAGVSGFFISDQVFPNRCGYMPGKQVVPVEEMLAKLMAALDARTDPDMLIGARTDVFQLEGMDAAIERCQLYMETGVDFAKPQGADTKADIAKVMQAVDCPHMANLSHAAGKWKVSLKELEEVGASMVSFPSAALFAAVGGVTRAMQSLKNNGDFEAVADEICPLDDYYDLVGLQGYMDAEQRYLDAAAKLAGKKAAAAE
jgi:2-methylisocitrate lyase-like PEP mutase family enzyme